MIRFPEDVYKRQDYIFLLHFSAPVPVDNREVYTILSEAPEGSISAVPDFPLSVDSGCQCNSADVFDDADTSSSRRYRVPDLHIHREAVHL